MESYMVDSPFQTFAVGSTSRRIYRLASLPLLSPETLSSLSKLRIFLFNVHLFVRRMTQLQSLNSIGNYCHLASKLILVLALEVVRAIPLPLADQTTSRIITELGKNVNVRSPTFRRCSSLVCG